MKKNGPGLRNHRPVAHPGNKELRNVVLAINGISILTPPQTHTLINGKREKKKENRRGGESYSPTHPPSILWTGDYKDGKHSLKGQTYPIFTLRNSVG